MRVALLCPKITLQNMYVRNVLNNICFEITPVKMKNLEFFINIYIYIYLFFLGNFSKK